MLPVIFFFFDWGFPVARGWTGIEDRSQYISRENNALHKLYFTMHVYIRLIWHLYDLESNTNVQYECDSYNDSS